MVVQCNSCHARFNAPSDFAGRKVRCRKCHAVFVVPRAGAPAAAAGGRNGADALFGDSLEPLGSEGPPGELGDERAGVGLPDPDELFQRVSSQFATPRSNPLYVYPMNHQVDRWLPFALALLPFAWACNQIFHTASAAGMPGWTGALRLTVILLGYLAIVFPACYWGVRVAARKCHYQLPYFLAWRVGSVFAMPYMFGVAMWLIAGQASDFVTGCLLGLVMALPALWLLLRLIPEEGPTTLSLAGGAFAGSTAVAVAVFLVFSLLANASAGPAHKPTALRQNPLGPGLRWDGPAEPPKNFAAARGRSDPQGGGDITTATGDVGPATPDQQDVPKLAPGDPFAPAATQTTNVAPAPVADAAAPARPVAAEAAAPNAELPPPSPLASSMRLGFKGRYDTVLSAPAPRAYMAVLTRTPGGQSNVTRWDIVNWKPAGEATFPGKESDFHLSSDGALVARVTTFPSLSLQVYSFLERRFRDPVPLDATQGEPTILGFAGPSSVVIHWKRTDNGGSSALEVVDAMAGKWIKRIPRIGNFEYAPGRFVISDDGRVAALLTREGRQGDTVQRTAQIELYALEASERLASMIPITQVAWNNTVRISGLALSPGRTEVSLLLENEGRGLMLSWDTGNGKLTRQYFEQAGLIPAGIEIGQFTGNALSYLDGGNTWLVYGCSIYDVGNGQRLGALNLASPVRQWVTGNTCYVYHLGEQGNGVMHAVKIDTTKLRGMLVKRTQ